MASINKLSVRGIRSFSPDDTEQVVEFYFPCTVILGQNGCGKTTIIESLKYAITGSLPPGNKSGQAFIHDPRSIGHAQVKANVKLRFTSRSGQTMVVVRSMELTQKKRNVTFKQLDGVLRMMDPNTGERVSLSHKCTELDRQLPSLLGISKAILDSVLFCHQEEASWPLQEGAVLKKKFDEIFDSTRYTKALDVFRKTEKELQMKTKDIKADIAALTSHKHAAEGFKAELREQTEYEEELAADKTKLTEELAEIEKEVAVFNEITDKVEELNSEIESLKNQRGRHEMALAKQKKMIDEDLSEKHTKEELTEMINDFDSKTAEFKEKEKELKKKLEAVQADIDQHHNQVSELKSKIGKIEGEKEAQEKRLKERITMMENLAKTYTLDLDTSQTQNASFAASLTTADTQTTLETTAISEDDMTVFNAAIEKKSEQLKDELKKHCDKSQEEDDVFQKELSELAAELKGFEKEKTEATANKKKIVKDLSDLSGTNRHQLTRQQKDVERLSKQSEEYGAARDKASEELKSRDIPAKIALLETKIDELKKKIQEGKKALDSLRDFADTQNTIKVLEEQNAKDFESLSESLKEHSAPMSRFNFEAITIENDAEDKDGEKIIEAVNGLVKDIKTKNDATNKTLKAATRELSKAESALSEKKAVLVSQNKALTSLNGKIKKLTDKGHLTKMQDAIKEIKENEEGLGSSLEVKLEADENSPDDITSYLETRLENLELDAPDNNAPDTTKKILRRIVKLAIKTSEDGSDSRECPCCKRGLETDEEKKVFEETMMEMMADPSILVRAGASEAYTKQKKQLQAWKKVISANANGVRDLLRLTKEAEELDAEVKELEATVTERQQAAKGKKTEVDDIQVQSTELKELVDSSKRWLEDARRIADQKVQIEQKRLDLTIVNPTEDRDIKTLEAEVAALNEEKDKFTSEINDMNKEMSKLNEVVTNSSKQASSTEKRANELKSQIEDSQKALEKREELLVGQKTIEDRVKELADEIAGVKSKIRKKELDRKKMKNEASAEESKFSDAVSDFNSDVKGLRDLTKQIEKFDKSGKTDKLTELQSHLETKLSKIEELKKEVQEMQPDIESAKSEVKDQERKKNNLKYNIQIMDEMAKVKELSEEITKKEGAVAQIEGHDTAFDKLNEITKKRNKVLERKAQAEGRYSEVVERIRGLKRKLAAPEYKNVDQQYRVAMIKFETTKIAAEDLIKYQKALDQALLQFHSVKIAEINKIIRELWMMTYKGEDINNIEIVTSQESDSKAKKSYNYRVVMAKGTSELDMRGRCSAGQRVLASIVIRLALAETFGVNCGCIALDEPTVNLDYDNKKGLAIALSNIIQARSHQRNFQLILITHDEEFVAMMKTELASLTGFSMPDKYFLVSRQKGTDGKYYSKINAVDWDDI